MASVESSTVASAPPAVPFGSPSSSQIKEHSAAVGRLVDLISLDIIMSDMTAISYTAARENLASTMDRVCADHNPIIITRNRGQSVVMLSLEDYEALEETAYLTRNPVNAKRLLDAIQQLETGRGIKRDLNIGS